MQTPAGSTTTHREEVITTACASHCGGGCLLKVHVRDGVIRRIETDDGAEPQLRACLRCRAYRQRVYDPERIRYPLRRTGPRGAGEFERISWDEALDTIAAQLARVRRESGPASVLHIGGGGDTMALHSNALIAQLLKQTGGATLQWGNASFEGARYACQASYGTLVVIGDVYGLIDSKLIILWGVDPATTIQNTNTTWFLARAHESGTRVIAVDPRFTDSAAVLADRWLPILPGTDCAALLAMAHTMITEDLYDRVFIAKYTIGFEKFADYVLGKDDAVPKTPEWAARVTGLAAESISVLAREYAAAKPAALIGGIAPGRTAYGEQFHRAVHALAAMTGNIGVRGGWAGRLNEGGKMFGGFDFKVQPFPGLNDNPVEAGKPPRPDSLPIFFGDNSSARIHHAKIADAILEGKPGGYPADIRMALIFQTNPVNQFPNTNRMTRALEKLDFIAVGEQVMTATARYADILLPVSTFMEREDLRTGGSPPFYAYVNQCLAPQYESKSLKEIRDLLATRLGLPDESHLSDGNRLRDMLRDSYVPDVDELKARGVYRVPQTGPNVAFREQIEDPENHPFPTPSGKIEIYAACLAEKHNRDIPPIPTYIEPWEGPRDPLTAKFPLQMVTTHFKRRAHSQFENVPWLRELMPQALRMSTADAVRRGIRGGDTVRVFNERGEVIVPVNVTQRIMPGVVELPQGAWYRPDAQGRDHGGCTNVLSRDTHSPGGASCYNTALVEVGRYESGDATAE